MRPPLFESVASTVAVSTTILRSLASPTTTTGGGAGSTTGAAIALATGGCRRRRRRLGRAGRPGCRSGRPAPASRLAGPEAAAPATPGRRTAPEKTETPRREPYVPLPLLRNRIDAVASKGVAARQATHSEPRAAPGAMHLHRLAHVIRARGVKPTAPCKER